jgi:hypothetical protein
MFVIVPAFGLNRTAGVDVFGLVVATIVVPVIIFAFVATSRARLLRWMQPATALANFLAGTVGAAYSAWLSRHDPQHFSVQLSLAGCLLINFFGFAVLRVRPALALAAAAPYMALAGAVDLANTPRVHHLTDLFVLASGLGSGLLINIVLDVTSRRTFRQERIIEAQKETIARERAKSEALLKQELGHQVAERSRELGALLARADFPVMKLDTSPGARFDARYKIVRAARRRRHGRGLRGRAPHRRRRARAQDRHRRHVASERRPLRA